MIPAPRGRRQGDGGRGVGSFRVSLVRLTRRSRRGSRMTFMRTAGRSRASRASVCWGIGILLIGMLLAEHARAQILEVDALLALKRLAAATTRGGLTYQEYASQLPVTKRTVDRFLQSPGGAPSAIPMALAMAYYELAGATWRASIERSTVGYIMLGQQLEQDHGACPHITGLIETATASMGRLDHRRASARREEIGKAATKTWPPVSWACAATQLAEAERSIREQK